MPLNETHFLSYKPDITYCVPCYDNPGSSVGLALGSGVYAGNVINEYRG